MAGTYYVSVLLWVLGTQGPQIGILSGTKITGGYRAGVMERTHAQHSGLAGRKEELV